MTIDFEKSTRSLLSIFGLFLALFIVSCEDDHDHDEEHEMALEIIGVNAGSTSFKLELMHDGHADYTSTNNVPITVK